MVEIRMSPLPIRLRHPMPKPLVHLISKSGTIIVDTLLEMVHSLGIQEPVHRVDIMETGKIRGTDKTHLTSVRLIVVEAVVAVAEVVAASAGLLDEEVTVAIILASTILEGTWHNQTPAL